MDNSLRRTFKRRVIFESLEPRLLLSADPLGAAELAAPSLLAWDAIADGAADDYTLRFNAASGELELLEGETLVASRALEETSAVVITGEDLQDDALTIDFTFGGFFSLAGGVRFDGGDGAVDLLSVTGGSFSSVTHSATGDGPGRSGTLVYEDGEHPALAISYANLEPIDMSGSDIENLVFNLPGLDDQAIIEDDGVAGNGVSQIRSQNGAPTFETTLFSGSAASLTVNMGMDSGSLVVAALPDFAGKSLTIDGQAGADSVSFLGANTFSSLVVMVAGSVDADNLSLTGASFISAPTFSVDALSVVATSGTVTVNAATSAGAVSVGGGVLLALNDTSSIGSLSLAGAPSGANLGGLGGSGNVTLLEGAHTWTSGLLSGAGLLRVSQDATLVVSGGNHFINGRPIINDGLLAWTGGVIDINNTGSLVNNGTFELAANSTFGNAFAPNGTLVLTNLGTISQHEAEVTTFGPGMTVNNRGTVEIAAGSVSFGGNGGTHTGRFHAAEGATLAFGGGTHNFTAASSVTVEGTLAVTAGTANLTSQLDLSGELRVTGGTANVAPASGALQPAGITVSGNGAVLNLTASGTLTPARVTIADAGTANLNSAVEIGELRLAGGGTVGSAGGLAGNGAVTLLAGGAHEWTSGNLSGAAAFTVAEGATLTVSGGQHFLNARPIVNDGVVRWTGGLIDINGAGSFANQGTLELAASSTLGDQFAPNGTLTINNSGVVRQEAGSNTFGVRTTLVNEEEGVIDVAAGFLNIGGALTQNGTVEIAAGAVLRRIGGFTSDGLVAGNGTIDVGAGTLVNTGAVAPEGTLTVAGNYEQSDGGHLEIEIGDEVDALVVTGTAILEDDSTLRASYREGFAPQAGERFRFMTFASLGGAFAGTELPASAVIEADATGLDLVAANSAPLAADDSFAALEDTPLVVAAPGVLGNDTDAELDALSAILEAGPAHGTLTFRADGSFEYLADADFFGQDSFTYRVSDGAFVSELATVFLDVAGVNDTPSALADFFEVGEDGTLEVAAAGVLANDADADGDALSATLESGPANGSLVLNADGSFTYRPNANFTGSDGFSYRAGDGAAASDVTTVSIQVAAVNDAPQAAADAFEVDGTLTVPAPGVLANDADADSATLTAKLVSTTANGVLVLNADGSFAYTPNEGFSGTDSFTYAASDGELDSAPVTVTLNVAGQDDNHAPTVDAGPDQVVGLQDVDEHDWWRWWCGDRPEAEVSVRAAFGDLELDDTHTATIDWGDGRVTTGRVVEATDGAEGAVKGDHVYQRAGVYTVTVTVTDSEGNVATDTLQVTVKNPIDKRNFDADADEYTLKEDSVLTVNAANGVLDNDRGPLGATLTVRVVEGPDHGTLVLNADGSFTYKPDADYHGEDSFWYEFTDGFNVSRAVEVELNVLSVPDYRPRYCDWGDRWTALWSDRFMPFGSRWY